MAVKKTFLIDLAGFAYTNATDQVIQNLAEKGISVFNQKEFVGIITGLNPFEAYDILNIPELETISQTEKSGSGWSYLAALLAALGLTAAQIAQNETGATPGIFAGPIPKPKPIEEPFYKKYLWEIVTGVLIVAAIGGYMYFNQNNPNK